MFSFDEVVEEVGAIWKSYLSKSDLVILFWSNAKLKNWY